MAEQTEDYGILISGNRWNDTPMQASVEDATLNLQQWVSQHSQDERVIFAVRTLHCDALGWQLQIKAWNPDTYQGRPFPTKTISYVPSLVAWKESEWMRGKTEGRLEAIEQCFEEWVRNRNTAEFLEKAFDGLFRVLMNALVPTVVVESLGHSIAVDAFLDNVQYNTALRRIEFECPRDLEASSLEFLPESLRYTYLQLSVEQQKRFDEEWLTRLNANRNADLCAKLLRRKQQESWTELTFLNLGTCSPRSIQKILGAVGCHDTLECLDLRAERRIHTWNKEKKRTRGRGNPRICVLPLVAGMANCKTLKTLDLSGIHLSSDSARALITSLDQNSTLTKLMLRDSFLDGSAVKALANTLKEDTCALQELDVSHNGASFNRRGVVQELCTALKANQTLQSLKLEHCGFKQNHLEVLAEALPDMIGLRHLSLNGNWDHKAPPCPASEDFQAYLAEGPGILVNALESNHHLLALNVGSLSSRSVRSCTTPSYPIYRLEEGKLTKLRDLLQRNNEAHNERMDRANVLNDKVQLHKMDRSFESSWLVDWRLSQAQAVAA